MNMVSQSHVDVLVLGAGPAASTVALNLAPFHRVCLLTGPMRSNTAVGETLPAAASRLLKDMGLWPSFLTQGHHLHRLSKSVWGSDAPHFSDSMRNLDGDGWHLDRPRFDAWMLSHALARGAAVLQSERIQIERSYDLRGEWRVQVKSQNASQMIKARWLVDATGRRAMLAKKMGVSPLLVDKLVCGWVIGSQSATPEQDSELHAEPDGWWYSAVLPHQRRSLAFYTDADLPAAKDAHTAIALLRRAQQLPELADLIQGTDFAQASHQSGFCAAHSAWLPQFTGLGWMAVGDAAMCFDPLSSQGIFNALYSGLAAATTLHDVLVKGDGADVAAYDRELQGVWQTFLQHRCAWYADQKRWPASEFWRRRADV
jgi:flavin-dependent dehydrogenase